MRTTTRFAMILLSIACINCGSSTDDEKTSNTDPVDEGANGDSNGGSTMPSTNGGGGIDATGGDDDADAGPTAEAPLTGQEPECVAAFTRISECYLSQAKCTPTAKSSAGALGTALSEGNCDAIAMQVGGLSNLAAQWNAQTACDAQTITGIFPSLDMIEQIKDLDADHRRVHEFLHERGPLRHGLHRREHHAGARQSGELRGKLQYAANPCLHLPLRHRSR
jgi:hypothetical protein